jgi:hypothetical protein
MLSYTDQLIFIGTMPRDHQTLDAIALLLQKYGFGAKIRKITIFKQDLRIQECETIKNLTIQKSLGGS